MFLINFNSSKKNIMLWATRVDAISKSSLKKFWRIETRNFILVNARWPRLLAYRIFRRMSVLNQGTEEPGMLWTSEVGARVSLKLQTETSSTKRALLARPDHEKGQIELPHLWNLPIWMGLDGKWSFRSFCPFGWEKVVLSKTGS